MPSAYARHLISAAILTLLASSSCQQPAEQHQPANQTLHQSALEALFGQVAKTVVYGGASFARFNSRLLCPLLAHETERDNEDQPTLFAFNNAQNKAQAFRIYADDDIGAQMLAEAHFSAHQMTLIYVHGWLGGIQNELWLSEAKNAALEAGQRNSSFSPNVLIVDWSEFAAGSLYAATQNSLKVARRLARLLEQLARVGRLRPELMHCLGHSIGAHICGQAARLAFPEQPRAAGGRPSAKMGRITGLDPGGFCYELGIRNETSYKGLKPSDALLVDAYYSNRSPFGNKYQVAHYNVRLSNGFFQRPCSVWRNPEVASEYFRAAVRFVLGNVGHNDVLTCDHYFATKFAQLSPPRDCSYVAYACHSYGDFLRGRCGSCSAGRCYPMDFEHQRQSPSTSGALAHIDAFSSRLQNQSVGAARPAGGVPYAQRRLYHMQVGREDHHCSASFRLRVRLNAAAVDVAAFRADWLTLRLRSNSSEQPLSFKDAASGADAESLILHGPWPSSGPRDGLEQLDGQTLTALLEFSSQQLADSPVAEVIVDYDNALSRRQDPFANPVESVHLDYLGSSDDSIRAKHSRSFQAHQVTVNYRHLSS